MAEIYIQDDSIITTEACEMFLRQNEVFNEQLEKIIEGVEKSVIHLLIHYGHGVNLEIGEKKIVKNTYSQIKRLAKKYNLGENTLCESTLNEDTLFENILGTIKEFVIGYELGEDTLREKFLRKIIVTKINLLNALYSEK